MIAITHSDHITIQLFWDDLSAAAKVRLLELLGNNGNYDCFPLAELYVEVENDGNHN